MLDEYEASGCTKTSVHHLRALAELSRENNHAQCSTGEVEETYPTVPALAFVTLTAQELVDVHYLYLSGSFWHKPAH